MTGFSSRIRSLFRRDDAESRMDEEFRFHLDMQTGKNIARGMPAEEARRQALLEFGGVERYREAMRDTHRPRFFAELAQDAHFTARALRHNRAFAITAVLIVSLGVGATTALFSLANALLFRELPVAAPDELYGVQEVRRGAASIGMEGRRVPFSRYVAYRDASEDVFTGLAAHAFQTVSLRTDGAAAPVQAALTSGNYFRVLGLRPAAGRFYAEDDEPSVVLSHRYWEQQFDGDPAVVGRPVHVDGKAYTIAGVAPSGFDGTVVALALGVWVPFRAHVATDSIASDSWVGMFGRVRNRVAISSAGARLSTIATRMPPELEESTVERAYLARMGGVPDLLRPRIGGFVGMLVAAGFLVLLIGAANIAAMLLARAVARRREVALRLALGAGRGRLVRQLLTESTVLFLLGGIGGIGLAYVVTGFLSRVRLPGVPVAIEAAPDLRVLAFALGIAGLTGLAFGLAPALQAVRLELAGALKGGGGAASGGGAGRMRGRSIFVGAQIAFAMLLLITAGLFVRGLQRGLALDPGFRADGVTVGTINLEPHRIGEEEGRVLQEELLRRVRALPGVTAASLARVVLLTGSSHSNDVSTVAPDSVRLTSSYNIVDTAYLGMMGIDVVAGRGFGPGDTRGAPPVVIINEVLARRLWPGRNPLGMRLRRGQEYEVVGIARDGRYVDLGEERREFMFFSAAQHYAPVMTLHVRTRAADPRLIESIREELRTVHPDVALEFAMPLPRLIGFSLLPLRLAAGLLGAFGVLGLVLAAAGVYGVMSYQVAQRTREFGIRIALGARAADVARLVLHGGVVLSIGGAVAGTAMAVAVTRLLRGMLFGLSPLDPVTFAAVGAALAAVAVLASWVPARRALRVDPTVSLRTE
jgi:predicted permease